MYNLVGFQTHLTFPEQRRVFRLIPGLENAEFLRYGVMHRNTYLPSPDMLEPDYSVRTVPNVYFAGQMTGVEGYVESCASGALVGIETAAQLLGLEPVNFPQETAIGAHEVSAAYKELVDAGEMPVILTTCCPTVNSLITKYYPDLIPMMAPVVSPVLAHGRMIKQRDGQDTKVVFIGPCLSKIREMGVSTLEPMKDFRFFTNGADCFSKISEVLNTHSIPDFSIGSLNFGLTPDIAHPSLLLLIPVLTFGVYFGTSKLTRKLTYQPTTANDPGMGCSTTVMDISMPLMSAVFTLWVPGAVGLYWAIKSIVGLGKQFIMSKVMPMPTFTEADYKAAERELAGKSKNKPVKKSGTRNPNVRSLHHIDDEDYDTSAKPAKSGKPTATETPDADKPAEAPAETRMGEGAVLKEDVPAEERRANRKKKKGGESPAETDKQDEVNGHEEGN